MGVGVAIAAILVGLTGLGLSAAGIYYTATDWGSENKGERARVYSLLISGIIVLALAIAGMAYYMLKPSTLAKNSLGGASSFFKK